MNSPMANRRFQASSQLRSNVKGPLLMPHQAAHLLGISKTQLRNLTRDKVLEVYIDPENGWTWYSELFLRAWLGLEPVDSNGASLRPLSKRERIAQKHRFTKTPSPSELHQAADNSTVGSSLRTEEEAALAKEQSRIVGQVSRTSPVGLIEPKVAQSVFRAMREGKSLADIVIEIGIHPAIARACADEYVDMTETLYLTHAEKKALDAMPMLEGQGFVLRNGEDLLDAVKKVLTKRSTCARCQKRSSRFCGDDACRSPEEEQNAAEQIQAANNAVMRAAATMIGTIPVAGPEANPANHPAFAKAPGNSR